MKPNKIKARRCLLGLTQRDAAERLGITASSYGCKEIGKYSFNDDENVKMKTILGFNHDEWNDLFYDGKLPLRDV